VFNPGGESPNVALFRVFMVIAALGTVLAAGYLLWLYQRVAFGEPTEEFAEDPAITDVSVVEWIAWVPIVVLIVALGFFPGIVMDITNPAVSAATAAFGG
jgi:NADH-quinone oxidoreductase subunit M